MSIEQAIINDMEQALLREAQKALNLKPKKGEDLPLWYKAWAFTAAPLRPSLLTMRVERYQKLLQAREQYRHPKDKDLTDFDRKTMLEASVASLQADYELVKGLEELVKEQLDLIKILLQEQ